MRKGASSDAPFLFGGPLFRQRSSVYTHSLAHLLSEGLPETVNPSTYLQIYHTTKTPLIKALHDLLDCLFDASNWLQPASSD